MCRGVTDRTFEVVPSVATAKKLNLSRPPQVSNLGNCESISNAADTQAKRPLFVVHPSADEALGVTIIAFQVFVSLQTSYSQSEIMNRFHENNRYLSVAASALSLHSYFRTCVIFLSFHSQDPRWPNSHHPISQLVLEIVCFHERCILILYSIFFPLTFSHLSQSSKGRISSSAFLWIIHTQFQGQRGRRRHWQRLFLRNHFFLLLSLSLSPSFHSLSAFLF